MQYNYLVDIKLLNGRTPLGGNSELDCKQKTLCIYRFLKRAIAIVGPLLLLYGAWLGWRRAWSLDNSILIANGEPLLFGVGLFLVLLWTVFEVIERYKRGTGLRGDFKEIHSNENSIDANTAGSEISSLLGYGREGVLLALLLDPASFIARITESVQVETRYIYVKTAFSFEFGNNLESGVFALPLIIQRKGYLIDALRIIDSRGNEIPSLGRNSLAVLISECFEKLLDGADQTDIKSFKESIQQLVRSPLPIETADIIRKFRDITETSNAQLSDKTLEACIDLMETLNVVHPVCVITNLNKDCPNRLVVHHKVSLAAVKRTYCKHCGALNALMRFLIRNPWMFYYGLGNANRAQSYHLKTQAGSEEYYEGSKLVFIKPRDDRPSAEYIEETNSVAQSGSHLHIGQGSGFENAAYVFRYESKRTYDIGVAFAGAIASLLLVLACSVPYLASLRSGMGFVDAGQVHYYQVSDVKCENSAIEALGNKDKSDPAFWSFDTNLATFGGLFTLLAVLPGVIGLVTTRKTLNQRGTSVPVWISGAATTVVSVLGIWFCLYASIGKVDLPLLQCVIPSLLAISSANAIVIALVFLGRRLALMAVSKRRPVTINLSDRKSNTPYKFNSERTYKDVIGSSWGEGWVAPSWPANRNAKDPTSEE